MDRKVMIRRNAYMKRENSFGQNISAAQSAGAGASSLSLADGRENHSDERGVELVVRAESETQRGREGEKEERARA